MAKIYLILQHLEGAKHVTSYVDSWMRQIDHERVGYRRCGVGGGGHNTWCGCLIVHRTTYRTRDAADKIAEQMQAENPGDTIWSLEVNTPEE